MNKFEKQGLKYIGNEPLCPWHNDRSPGSFKFFNDSKGKLRCKCHSCGKSGNTDDLLIQLYLNGGILTQEQVNLYYAYFTMSTEERTNREVRRNFFNVKQKIREAGESSYDIANQVDGEIRAEMASPDIRNKVYSYAIKKSDLTDDDIDNLFNRGLSDVDIEKYNFRSTSSVSKISLKSLHSILGESLLGVPGVVENGDDYHIQIPGDGIVIPITQDNKITALQVRLNNGPVRYKWISSKNYTYTFNGIKKYGNSPGAAWGNIGSIEDDTVSIVTEGFFKAKALHDVFGDRFNIYYVQGITNTKGVVEHINEMSPKGVLIAFDMDLYVPKSNSPEDIGKNQTHIKVLNELKDSLESSVKFLQWDYRYKGFDDFVNLVYNNDMTKRTDIQKYLKDNMILNTRDVDINN